jgi:hypothetical protein
MLAMWFIQAGTEGTSGAWRKSAGQDSATCGPAQKRLGSGVVNSLKRTFVEQMRGAVRDKVQSITVNWNSHLIPLQWSMFAEDGIKRLVALRASAENSLPLPSIDLSHEDVDRATRPTAKALHKLTAADRKTIDFQMETLYTKCTSDGSPDCRAYLHWLSDTYHRHLAVPDSTIGIFGEETLNVFIAGGGPVGLFLANAIASSFSVEQVRVVVVEKRTFANGTKRPYTRKWPTYLEKSLFDGVVDPRLMPILQDFSTMRAQTHTYFVQTEIHALETALLLSCRSLGVRFLFQSVPGGSCSGKSFRNTEIGKILCRQASLRIDATGNRLRRFDKRSLIESNQWVYEDMQQKLHETFSRQRTIGETGLLIGNGIVSYRNVLFPIYPRAGAYVMHYLKILHLPVALAPLLRRVQELCPFETCGQIYLWECSTKKELTMFFNLRWHEVHIFKEVIEDQLLGARLDNSFMHKLSELGRAHGGIGVEGRLTEALRSVLAACQVRALVGCERVRLGAYAYDPFFIVPQEPKTTLTESSDGRSSAVSDPDDWIRIGDSVFQGYFLLGDGLGTHFAILGNFVRRWKEQSSNFVGVCGCGVNQTPDYTGVRVCGRDAPKQDSNSD